MGTMTKSKKIVLICICLGMAIYMMRYFRDDFKGHDSILYWLGFMPNFGMSFAFPFIFSRPKNIFSVLTEKINFYIGCIILFIIMVLHEIVDKYQPRRVFDWMDIWASLVGVLCAAVVYYFVLKNEESEV
jgi:drug/metabolite transporter (DMT)-like permease